ncbi:MAG: hypothetical protein GC190_13055 [Alphaproteobacteria bacterium]|nr:hypothetical protein [Alphaproteobacteria bacterium]
MLGRIFPRQIDNSYQGYWTAVWLLVLLLLFKSAISFNAVGWNPMMTGGEVLQRADRIPLDTFSTNAANAAILLFATWGVTHFALNLLGFIAVARYRAMIPIVYLLLLFDHIGRKAMADTYPIIRTETTLNVPVNIILITLLFIGFGLSISTPRRREARRG